MRRALPSLVVIAVIASLLPAFWISAALCVPFLNLYTWRIHASLGLSKWQYVLLQCAHLLRAVGITLGAVLSVRFAIRSIRSRHLHISPAFVLALLVAVACGVHLEATSDKAPPWRFPLGFFEIPALSWVVVGIVASRSSNIAVQETGARDARPGS